MKQGERFRIGIEAVIVLVLAVGVVRFYQVRQQRQAEEDATPSLSDDRGVGRLIKLRADEQEARPQRIHKGSDEDDREKHRDVSVEPNILLPEPALLVIQVLDAQGAAFLEPVTVYSVTGRFTNQVTSGRLALSLTAMTLDVGGQWEAFPSLKIEPVRITLEAGKTSGVVLVVDPGVLPGFDLVRENDLLIVSRVEGGSPAALAGLQIDDIVVEVAGIPAEQLNDLALLGVLESPLVEPLVLTIAEPAGDEWTAVSVILQP